jgi:hypothetical protein
MMHNDNSTSELERARARKAASGQAGAVCAWCDVYCRETVEARTNDGELISSWSRCLYCKRTELRYGKLGHQTPLPDDA